MQVRFWGVRGSLPTPERYAWRYGGNTPCLEVRTSDRIIIFDAGSGIRALGHQLASQGANPGLQCCLLLNHYHWDHIQGLPFFAPLYVGGNTIHIFGPHLRRHSPRDPVNALQELFQAPFFPVSTSELKAGYTLSELDWESHFTLGDIDVQTCGLRHPQGSLAYRLDYRGASIVYASDHEPGDRPSDSALQQLADGADLLIMDSQYTPEELRTNKAGWGHGCWQTSVEMARQAQVRTLSSFTTNRSVRTLKWTN